MKLRILKNAVRLRVNKTELDQFLSGHPVIETVEFSNASLQYALMPTPESEMKVSFNANRLAIHLPMAWGKEWEKEDKVGFEAVQEFNGKTMDILVEKDFKCLSPERTEDESNNFDHPTIGHNC